MIARTESVQSWLETVTHQMNNMSYKQQSSKLAGQIAFLKMWSTKMAQQTAEDATQIFGGRGITRTGMGRFIEHVRRLLLPVYRFRSDVTMRSITAQCRLTRCWEERRTCSVTSV